MAGILLEMIRPVPAGRRLFLVLKSVGMDSLALIECQRITALIESAVEKLGILASLTSGGWNLSLMNIEQMSGYMCLKGRWAQRRIEYNGG